MDELTFDYTLDSYRASTVNAPYLLHEARKLLQRLEADGQKPDRAKNVLDEMELKLRNNSIVASLVSIPLDTYISYDRENTDDILRKLYVLSREIDPSLYALRAMELIKEEVWSNRKSFLDFYANELVTTLLNMGMSPSFINKALLKRFYQAGIEVSIDKSLCEFFKEIFPHRHEFQLLYKVRSAALANDLGGERKFGLHVSEEVPDPFKIDPLNQSFYNLVEDQKYVLVEDISALDVYSAMQAAEARIVRLHDFFRIYHHKDDFDVSTNAVSEQCCAPGIRLIQRLPNRMQFVNDYRPKKAAKKLRDLFGSINLPAGGDREKFFRIVDFHGMSVSSEVLENQILNMWISMETIVPSNVSKSKIENVVRGFLPMIGLNYFRRILERVAFDLIRWDREKYSKIIKKTSPRQGSSVAERAFLLIALEENEAHLRELFESLSNYELLKFRVFELHKVLRRRNTAKKKLEEHQTRVDWQIRRIYRTRNEIVHSGRTPSFSTMLVQNAHDYFDQVFSTSCDLCSGDGGFRDFQEAFDYASWGFDQYKSNLDADEGFNKSDASLLIWSKKAKPNHIEFLNAL